MPTGRHAIPGTGTLARGDPRSHVSAAVRNKDRDMSNTSPSGIDVSFNVPPHAYDPATTPEYFAGVLTRRVLAFLIDVVVIAVLVAFTAVFIFAFGFVTLGLGWLLFFLLPAATVIWAVLYNGFTLGSPASATIGMRVMDIEMRTWYGSPAYFVLGAVHAVAFWISVSALSPLVLLLGLFNDRRRLLHDFLLGTVVINNEVRAGALRGLRRRT
jgi:uncharacterized RDD family membrane protein YckC